MRGWRGFASVRRSAHDLAILRLQIRSQDLCVSRRGLDPGKGCWGVKMVATSSYQREPARWKSYNHIKVKYRTLKMNGICACTTTHSIGRYMWIIRVCWSSPYISYMCRRCNHMSKWYRYTAYIYFVSIVGANLHFSQSDLQKIGISTCVVWL